MIKILDPQPTDQVILNLTIPRNFNQFSCILIIRESNNDKDSQPTNVQDP